jgi:hypothetical protein
LRRFLAVSTTFAVLASLAVVAQAASKPVSGDWSGSKSLKFSVNSAGTKITDFRPGGCALGPLGWSMPIKNGKFSLKQSVSLEGGRPVKLKITGSFTSGTTAKGTISYGTCKQKFTATGPKPPPPPPPPDPTTGY